MAWKDVTQTGHHQLNSVRHSVCQAIVLDVYVWWWGRVYMLGQG